MRIVRESGGNGTRPALAATVAIRSATRTAEDDDWVGPRPDPGLPLVVAITSDPDAQADLVRRIGGTAQLLLLPDLSAALGLLGRVGRERPAAERALPVGFEIDQRQRRVRWRGTTLALTEHERGLLSVMADDPGRVWTHEHLHQVVWRTSYLPTATDLQSVVKRLRKKLTLAGVPLRIEAVRGVGFQLRQVEEV